MLYCTPLDSDISAITMVKYIYSDGGSIKLHSGHSVDALKSVSLMVKPCKTHMFSVLSHGFLGSPLLRLWTTGVGPESLQSLRGGSWLRFMGSFHGDIP